MKILEVSSEEKKIPLGIKQLKEDFAEVDITRTKGLRRKKDIAGFPNIDDAGRQLKKGEAVSQNSYFRKRFFNAVLDHSPELEKQIDQYLNEKKFFYCCANKMV